MAYGRCAHRAGKRQIHLPDAYWATVSPDGTALASMRGGVIRVAYLNSKQVTKACTYHGTKYYSDDVCFTADSQRLWTTLWNEDESGRLALLDAETLSEIASVPMPKARADDLDYWSEPVFNSPHSFPIPWRCNMQAAIIFLAYSFSISMGIRSNHIPLCLARQRRF